MRIESRIWKSWYAHTIVLCICSFVLLFGSVDSGHGQGWSELSIRLLSDGAFAVVEISEGGKKTKHCPHHDHNGKLDEEQLIYVIGTIDAETWVDSANKAIAKKHLAKHYDAFIKKTRKDGLKDKVNINTAELTELVRLPHVGPFLAVKITEYRNSHSRFVSFEELREIEGIGSETFNAIRHYVKL